MHIPLVLSRSFFFFFFFNDTATTEIYTLSLHDALPICKLLESKEIDAIVTATPNHWHALATNWRSEEHTSELQSQSNLVCRLLLEKKKKQQIQKSTAQNNITKTQQQQTNSSLRSEYEIP